MEISKDRRIRKTKTAIHTALLELIAEKNLSQITVKELTEKADVNRKTFYNHYRDIYAVLDEVEDECVDRILSLFDMETFDEYIENHELFFIRMITEIRENQDFYMLLNQSACHSSILNKMIYKEKELLRKLIDMEQMDETWVNCFLNYASAGTISVISNWFSYKQDIPIESFAKFFSTLFTASDMKRFRSIAGEAGTDPGHESWRPAQDDDGADQGTGV